MKLIQLCPVDKAMDLYQQAREIADDAAANGKFISPLDTYTGKQLVEIAMNLGYGRNVERMIQDCL